MGYFTTLGAICLVLMNSERVMRFMGKTGDSLVRKRRPLAPPNFQLADRHARLFLDRSWLTSWWWKRQRSELLLITEHG